MICRVLIVPPFSVSSDLCYRRLDSFVRKVTGNSRIRFRRNTVAGKLVNKTFWIVNRNLWFIMKFEGFASAVGDRCKNIICRSRQKPYCLSWVFLPLGVRINDGLHYHTNYWNIEARVGDRWHFCSLLRKYLHCMKMLNENWCKFKNNWWNTRGFIYKVCMSVETLKRRSSGTTKIHDKH